MSKPVADLLRVVVVGASGFGRESLDVLEAMIEAGSSIEILGVVDDFPSSKNLERLETRGITYLGTVDHLLADTESGIQYVLGIGDPKVRKMLATKFEAAGFIPFSAIHPTVVLGAQTSWSPGVVICAGAVISTNVNLGHHVHINPNATVGHDTILEDYVSLNPASVISGDVVIGQKTLVGAAATILQGLVVGADSVIGACACVTKDIPSGVTVKGIPAR